MALMESSAHNAWQGHHNKPGQMNPGALRSREIRRWIEDWKDPYLREEERPQRPSICSECGAIYANHRWYAPEDAPMPAGSRQQIPRVVCPADRRLRERLPGGILTVSGTFYVSHRQSLEELVQNECIRARSANELERIIQWRNHGDSITLETTNPRLAQRLGHALERAYHGKITYKWSDGNRLARVDWKRDL